MTEELERQISLTEQMRMTHCQPLAKWLHMLVGTASVLTAPFLHCMPIQNSVLYVSRGQNQSHIDFPSPFELQIGLTR